MHTFQQTYKRKKKKKKILILILILKKHGETDRIGIKIITLQGAIKQKQQRKEMQLRPMNTVRPIQ